MSDKPNAPGSSPGVMTEEERKKKIREGTYMPASGGISPGAHPGATKPTEDPRNDAGLNPKPQPKK